MPTDSRQCLKQSQWQKKYKNRTSTVKATAKMSSPSRRRLLQFQDALDHDKIGNDDASVGAWINLIQRRADEEAATKATLPELSCGFPIPYDRLPPTDDEVGAVIAEMERLLSGRTTAPTNPLEYSFLHDDPSIDDSSTNSCTNNNKPRNLPPKHYSLSISSGEQSFSGDHVALVFRRTKGEVIKKKCLTALSQHCQKEKRRLRWIAKLVAKSQRGKILGRVYMNWKHHVRMMKVKESLLACKIGRVLSKKFRRSFAAWKQMTLDRKEIGDLLIERFRQKNLRRIVVDWSKRNRETKALSEVRVFVLALASLFPHTFCNDISYHTLVTDNTTSLRLANQSKDIIGMANLLAGKEGNSEQEAWQGNSISSSSDNTIAFHIVVSNASGQRSMHPK